MKKAFQGREATLSKHTDTLTHNILGAGDILALSFPSRLHCRQRWYCKNLPRQDLPSRQCISQYIHCWAWASIPRYKRQLVSILGEAELFGPYCDLSGDCPQREERGLACWGRRTHTGPAQWGYWTHSHQPEVLPKVPNWRKPGVAPVLSKNPYIQAPNFQRRKKPHIVHLQCCPSPTVCRLRTSWLQTSFTCLASSQQELLLLHDIPDLFWGAFMIPRPQRKQLEALGSQRLGTWPSFGNLRATAWLCLQMEGRHGHKTKLIQQLTETYLSTTRLPSLVRTAVHISQYSACEGCV